MMEYYRRHVQGHIRYYGVSGNYQRLARYVELANRLLFKWLNRRSQRRSLSWERFGGILEDGLAPRIRIVHDLYPKPL